MNGNRVLRPTIKFDRIAPISSLPRVGPPTDSLPTLSFQAGRQEIGAFAARVLDP